MNTYFITGATGVLGSAIVRELIVNNTQDKLILLIRANSEEALQERVEWLRRFLEIDFADIERRVGSIRGDTEIENFGLCADKLIEISESITHIIHCAASVRMNLPLKQARLAAVTATKSVIQLAQLCKQNGVLHKVEMVSTVGVGGRWRGALPERWINEPRLFHNTYEQSKAEAEAVMEQQAKNGLPITVHRPSMIVGDSRNGSIPHFQIFYHLIEFIAGRRTWGVLPNLSHQCVDLVPADFVAKVIVRSSMTDQTIGKILHLCAGPELAVSLETLKTIARKKFEGHNLIVPREYNLPMVWFGMVTRLMVMAASKRQKRRLAALPIFLDYLSEDQVFENKDTLKIVESFGFSVPKPKNFLDPIFDYYLSRAYFCKSSIQ